MADTLAGFETLRKRLTDLVASLERGDVDPRALEGALYSVRMEFERLQSNAFGMHVRSAGDRDRREDAAREVQRLVAVALDLAAHRRDEIAVELDRTREARRRLGFYKNDASGDSCDIAG
ncbi:MAG: hypothetical protein K8S98_06085 [Planctomycetes bacterium]|nr:hypothetical protein [Planctomycetota bacterium]